MKKFIMGVIFLLMTTVAISTGGPQGTVPPSDPVNGIVDDREIFQEKDLEEIRLPEIKNEDIARKISELETNDVLHKEKIATLERAVNEKNQQITQLENRVEKMMALTDALEKKTEELNDKGIDNIKNKIYKTGVIVLSALAGITIVLIAIVLLQSNKNKKLVEEWQEFFDMNIERLKRDINSSPKSEISDAEKRKNEFMERMKRDEELDDIV